MVKMKTTKRISKIGRLAKFSAVGFSLWLCACTSESKIKALTLEATEKSFEEYIRKEADTNIQNKEIYKINYLSSIKSKSEFEVDRVEVNGSAANAIVQVTTVPEKTRLAVLEIIEKRPSENGYSLNISDAIDLVSRQQKITTQMRSRLKYSFTLKKESFRWIISSQELLPATEK